MYRTDSIGAGPSGLPLEPAQLSEPAPRIPARSLLERVGKRGMDVIAALILMAVGLPLYVFIALGVKLTSPGPVHYWQYRLGRGGKRFRFYKIRSMFVDGDEQLKALLATDEIANSNWQIYQKLERDPRVTRFGRFIRRTSLDELPQFWNVLKGDMSLVGPRPCMEQQEHLYGGNWSAYCSVRPGLTGLWQVSGRNRLSFRERVQLDLAYVQEWSVYLDIKIVLRTVRAVLSGDGSQ